jgi:hypothetical protein
MRTIVLVIAALALAACISRTIVPIDNGVEEVCVVRNPNVWPEFLDVYVEELRTNGYKVSIVDTEPSPGSCPIVSIYMAKRGVGYGPYLAYVDIKVLRGPTIIGRAQYKAPRSLAAEGSVTAKIKGIVDELYSPKLFSTNGPPTK